MLIRFPACLWSLQVFGWRKNLEDAKSSGWVGWSCSDAVATYVFIWAVFDVSGNWDHLWEDFGAMRWSW